MHLWDVYTFVSHTSQAKVFLRTVCDTETPCCVASISIKLLGSMRKDRRETFTENQYKNPAHKDQNRNRQFS